MNCLYCNSYCKDKGQYLDFHYFECETCEDIIQYRFVESLDKLHAYWIVKEPYCIEVSYYRKEIVIYMKDSLKDLLKINKIDEHPINYEKYISRLTNMKAFL